MIKFLKRFIALRRKRREQKKGDEKLSFTKVVVCTMLCLATAWITWSYVLATTALLLYGSTDPLSDLSSVVCQTVIATVISYCAKALCENISKYNFGGNDEKQDELEIMG